MAKVCPRCSELLPDEAAFCPFDGAELPKHGDRFLGRIIASRYRLTRKLGSGGMSVVYLARHELIDRLSAIKILRPELSRMPEHRERFLREARAVNRVNHENIVEITDVGQSDGVAYLVMEYIEGESLLAHIQRGPMRWHRAARVAIQVASALARTHQAGIIHRDLKPENILLVPRKASRARAGAAPLDANERVKLTDFGIAKVVGEPNLTMNEQLFGTPGYIAPEYVTGLPIDGRADIYSLAVVLYEMITGHLPFEGRGHSDLLLKPLTTDPIPPSQRVRGLPAELEELVMRCLGRDPDVRPHDAFAVHDALLAIVEALEGADLREEPRVDRASDVVPREPLETIVDQVVERRELDTPRVDRIVTKEMSSRWAAALVDLELRVTTARREGGPLAQRAGRAAELAATASELLPRVERATKVVTDLQATVDRLEEEGRAFRASLGHAIDVLVHDRSRERAHGNVAVVDDLTFQIDALQRQLDAKNDEHDRKVLAATARLEGALSALRRLSSEIGGTIDEGVELLAVAS